jgi:hypothetical protein
MERSIHDSLSVVKRTMESGSVVPGGGAVETALSIYLENFATTLVSWPGVLSLSNCVNTATTGKQRTTCDCRVCCRALDYSKDARRQCREGFLGLGG